METYVDIENVFKEIRDEHGFQFTLKHEQVRIIHAILHRSDAVGIFPTGFGKSMCFTIPPLILKHLGYERCLSLVISPLKSIMTDQCSDAKRRNISAICVKSKSEMSSDDIDGLKHGRFSVIYVSPETLLSRDMFWRRIFLDGDTYKKKLCMIAVDEVHLIESWGLEFRPTFSKIGDLRSFFVGVPFLLLSATCGKTMLSQILSKLHIFSSVMEIHSPDRPNIVLKLISKAGMDPIDELSWLLNELAEKKDTSMKSLVYVRSLTTLGKLYRDFWGYVRQRTVIFSRSLISCYHSGLSDSDQERIICEFSKQDSKIRLMICTVAFGVGVNIPDVRNVIHWGVSSTAIEYWQEVGRAGRDGNESRAYLYATKASMAHTSEDMKKIVRAASEGICFRQSVLNCFISSEEVVLKKTTCSSHCLLCRCQYCACCSVCMSKCACSSYR